MCIHDNTHNYSYVSVLSDCPIECLISEGKFRLLYIPLILVQHCTTVV